MKFPAPIKCDKKIETVRFLTFNVNGIRTLFHYHPFSEMNHSLATVFDHLESDIITFQELKIDRASISKWGKTPGFSSFISIPLTKRGYSGVGCWVRNYPEEHPLHQPMQVLKAEEGITGILTIKVGKNNVKYRDDPSIGIGGYEALGISENDEKECIKLDSEGRCVMVELACNVVVISVYCPANSTLSYEGESFRLKFLTVLFKRIRNIDKMGKKIVLMGDINVCRDLCDNADSLENASIPLNSSMNGIELEQKYRELCEAFVLNPETPHRRLFNQLLHDSMIPEIASDGILIDTTRLIQTRKRLKMYTVWNTLKNTRSVNYGSRIDFILIGLVLKDKIEAADILPQVMGSDHCPVFADLKLQSSGQNEKKLVLKLPKFEARYKYGLIHGNILEMFGKNGKSLSTKVATKKSSLSNKTPGVHKQLDLINSPTARPKDGDKSTTEIKDNLLITHKQKIFGETPLCKHGLKAISRTSKTAANPGKRFWVCKLPKGSSEDISASCGFFQWG